jgi:hypothetical protein
MIDQHKIERKSFEIWVKKSMTKTILFSDEKCFYLNGTFYKQNHRIDADTREEADDEGDIHRKTQFSPSVMVYLGVCYERVTQIVIIEEGTINSKR